jgi:predicted DNA-binding protein YlxM (UPF0122 family)
MNEHPSPEQFLIREALNEFTSTQHKVWDLYNFEQLSIADIGRKLRIAPQGVSRHIKACETKIKKYVRQNIGAYNLLKSETGEPNE